MNILKANNSSPDRSAGSFAGLVSEIGLISNRLGGWKLEESERGIALHNFCKLTERRKKNASKTIIWMKISKLIAIPLPSLGSIERSSRFEKHQLMCAWHARGGVWRGVRCGLGVNGKLINRESVVVAGNCAAQIKTNKRDCWNEYGTTVTKWWFNNVSLLANHLDRFGCFNEPRKSKFDVSWKFIFVVKSKDADKQNET